MIRFCSTRTTVLPIFPIDDTKKNWSRDWPQSSALPFISDAEHYTTSLFFKIRKFPHEGAPYLWNQPMPECRLNVFASKRIGNFFFKALGHRNRYPLFTISGIFGLCIVNVVFYLVVEPKYSGNCLFWVTKLVTTQLNLTWHLENFLI